MRELTLNDRFEIRNIATNKMNERAQRISKHLTVAAGDTIYDQDYYINLGDTTTLYSGDKVHCYRFLEGMMAYKNHKNHLES